MACCWILFGDEEPPQNRRADTMYVRLPEPWEYYLDPARVNMELKSAIQDQLKKWGPKLIFRPLELSYEPYLDSIAIPQVVNAQLLKIPLLSSASRQAYFLDPHVVPSVRADLVRMKYEQQSFSRAVAIISNSKTTAADLERHYPQFAAKHRLCSPPGASDAFFSAPILNVTRSALFFGRLNHQKGIPHLLRPVPAEWNLTVAGRGKWKTASFEKFGIRHLDWIGGAALLAEVSRSAFCLFPSHYEPWGLSLNEALAAGRICVVQPGAGGHEEQIENGRNGFFFDFATGDFWKFLEELIRRPDLLEISRQARLSARPWQRHLAETVTLLTELADTSAATAE
jgi:glycosyltransferase involved in cell wall biosynthesis